MPNCTVKRVVHLKMRDLHDKGAWSRGTKSNSRHQSSCCRPEREDWSGLCAAIRRIPEKELNVESLPWRTRAMAWGAPLFAERAHQRSDANRSLRERPTLAIVSDGLKSYYQAVTRQCAFGTLPDRSVTRLPATMELARIQSQTDLVPQHESFLDELRTKQA